MWIKVARDRKEITRWTERENYKLCGQRQETFADVDGSVGNSPMSRDSFSTFFFGNFADHSPQQWRNKENQVYRFALAIKENTILFLILFLLHLLSWIGGK